MSHGESGSQGDRSLDSLFVPLYLLERLPPLLFTVSQGDRFLDSLFVPLFMV